MSEDEENKRNSYNCFNIRTWLVLAFMIVFCILPFFSILMIRYGGGYNVIAWRDYYSNDLAKYNYIVNGTHVSYSNDSQNQQMRINNLFTSYNVPTGTGNATKEVTYGSKQYQFVMNGTSDLVFTSQYLFPKKTIYHYYPLIYGLPIGVTIGRNKNDIDKYTGNIIVNMTLNPLSFIIPSNWTDFWNNIDIIFYYVDIDNNGIGISYGNNQSDTNTLYNRTIDTEFGQLNLDMLPLNVSGDDVYPKYIDTYNDTIMVSKYHSYPFSNDTFLSEYISNALGFTTDDALDSIQQIVPILKIEQKYVYSEYDNPIFEIRQLQGFPSWYDYPTLKNAEKCGFYISVKKEFNVTKYFSIYDAIDMGHLLNTGEFLINGLSFFDGGLYLGKVETMIQAIERVFYYDIALLLGTLCVIVSIMLIKNYPKLADDQKKLQRTTCIID